MVFIRCFQESRMKAGHHSTSSPVNRSASRSASQLVPRGGGEVEMGEDQIQPPPVGSCMDGRVVAIQLEDFGLSKSAVATEGHTSNLSKVES